MSPLTFFVIDAVPRLLSKVDTTVFVAGFGALAAGAFAIALVLSLRSRDPLALFACAGALPAVYASAAAERWRTADVAERARPTRPSPTPTKDRHAPPSARPPVGAIHG